MLCNIYREGEEEEIYRWSDTAAAAGGGGGKKLMKPRAENSIVRRPSWETKAPAKKKACQHQEDRRNQAPEAKPT